jgi:hypothetical protein
MIRKSAIAASAFFFAIHVGMASGRMVSWQDAAQPSAPAQNPAPVASATSASSSSSSSSSPAKPKSKKTWTNDNVGDANGTISVVGSANSGSPGGKASKPSLKGATSASVDPKVVASLREQLHRLQAQLNIVEKQYSDLKAQSRGESKSAGGLQANTYNYDSSSVEEQLRHLQDKKKRIEDTMDQLLDAARKAGIEPGDLR